MNCLALMYFSTEVDVLCFIEVFESKGYILVDYLWFSIGNSGILNQME